MTENPPRHEDAGPPPPAAAADAAPAPASWRLTFEYEGADVRIVDRQAVATQAPPDDAALLDGARAGFWLEIHDAAGHALYHQVIRNPIRRELETFSPERGVSPGHVAAPVVSGVFQVLIPDLPDGEGVVVHGAPSLLGPGAATRADEGGGTRARTTTAERSTRRTAEETAPDAHAPTVLVAASLRTAPPAKTPAKKTAAKKTPRESKS